MFALKWNLRTHLLLVIGLLNSLLGFSFHYFTSNRPFATCQQEYFSTKAEKSSDYRICRDWCFSKMARYLGQPLKYEIRKPHEPQPPFCMHYMHQEQVDHPFFLWSGNELTTQFKLHFIHLYMRILMKARASNEKHHS